MASTLSPCSRAVPDWHVGDLVMARPDFRYRIMRIDLDAQGQPVGTVEPAARERQ
jgi:hypothetical protein